MAVTVKQIGFVQLLAVYVSLNALLAERLGVNGNSSRCKLECVVQGREAVQAKCRILNNTTLTRDSCHQQAALRNVSILDLGNNGLVKIPSWIFRLCKNLTALSVANNNIKSIEENTFKNLTNLRKINLTSNNLAEWKVDPKNELQMLDEIIAGGNNDWVPSTQILRLKSLRKVSSITWNDYCKACDLLRVPADFEASGEAEVASGREEESDGDHDDDDAPEASDSGSAGSGDSLCYKLDELGWPDFWQWSDQVPYGRALDFIKLGFWPTCLCDPLCENHEHGLQFFQAEYGIILKANAYLYATGSLALLFNASVIILIASRKSLRCDIAAILMLNIAVSDVFVGVFILLYATWNFDSLHLEYQAMEIDLKDFVEKTVLYGNIMGVLLTCAVISQVLGGLLSTLEKVLKIVFAMRPNVRMGWRTASVCIATSWLISVTLAVLPTVNVGDMTYIAGSGAPLPTDYHDEEFSFVLGPASAAQLGLITFQLMGLFLYIPIFIVARRSGASLGVKREAKIAKKIALLVGTNFVLFAVPVLLGVFQHGMWILIFTSHTLTLFENQALFFVCYSLPIFLVNLNSILNPFLYAFRYPRIKNQIKSIYTTLYSSSTNPSRQTESDNDDHPRSAQNIGLEMSSIFSSISSDKTQGLRSPVLLRFSSTKSL